METNMEIKINESYDTKYLGKTFLEISLFIKESFSRSPININNSIVEYHSSVPEETPESEHLLTTIRRFICSILNREQKKDAFLNQILEPINIQNAILMNNMNEGNKNIYNIYYETGKLFSEFGLYDESMKLFRMAEKTTDIVLRYYARIGLVEIIRNSGKFRIAINEIEKIQSDFAKDEKEKLTITQRQDIQYFLFKHKATILRRLYYKNLTDNSKATKNSISSILQSFKLSENSVNSYHIQYSIGFFYYTIKRFDDASSHYSKCRSLLGEYTNEYYFIHLFEAINLMALNIEKLDYQKENIFENEIQPLIISYTNSKDSYGNFKDNINDLLVSVINGFMVSKYSLEYLKSSIEKKIKQFVTTRELLFGIKNDLLIIIEFCLNTIDDGPGKDFYNDIHSIIHKYDKRFEKKSLLIEEKPYLCKMNGIALCVDTRGMTNISNAETNIDATYIQSLRELLKNNLVDEFDDVNFTGDGFIMTKYLDDIHNKIDKNTYTRKIIILIKKVITFLADVEKESFDVGVGIACGILNQLKTKDNEYHFIGKAANLAARMSDIARPKGFAIHYDSRFLIIDNIKMDVSVRNIKNLRGKHENETYDVLLSSDINELCRRYDFDFKYISKPISVDEKRIFINYGNKCKLGCIYCVDIDQKFHPFKINHFSKEYTKLRKHENINDHLISLGCFNDPLLDNNLNSTVDLISFLLEKFKLNNTNNTIQIATKANYDVITLFNNLLMEKLTEPQKQFSKSRIFVFYSISTISYNSIEPNRIYEDIELLKRKEENFLFKIIPYVKPFLPGLTDKDERLLAFLKDFPILVIGYPYFSRRTMNAVANWCIVNNNKKLAESFYNFSLKLLEQPLPLSHPGRIAETSYAFNYKDELNNYINRLKKLNKELCIFTSSPCAVAYLNNVTCYTNVGSANNCISMILCSDDCQNKHCIYNEKNYLSSDLEDRIKSKLKFEYSIIVDPSHSLDHFLRVHKIALNIAKSLPSKDTLSDEDKKVLSTACLLHDIGDLKLNDQEEDRRELKVRNFLASELEHDTINESFINRVVQVVSNSSFEDLIKEPNHSSRHKNSLDPQNIIICKILEDADRIDAIGAIGIARCFAFPKNIGIFNPSEEPRNIVRLKNDHKLGYDKYRSAMTHFFEKLIHLHDNLHLKESQEYAMNRNKLMYNFIEGFLDEYGEGTKLKEKLYDRKWFKGDLSVATNNDGKINENGTEQ